ncbi:hypothetical protein SBDP1_500042 [Syntrophobacter sp. SbD1]|nr:hypothetical protein SBDP1_500042 [Syntrophobacter sp. SbD1]
MSKADALFPVPGLVRPGELFKARQNLNVASLSCGQDETWPTLLPGFIKRFKQILNFADLVVILGCTYHPTPAIDELIISQKAKLIRKGNL